MSAKTSVTGQKRKILKETCVPGEHLGGSCQIAEDGEIQVEEQMDHRAKRSLGGRKASPFKREHVELIAKQRARDVTPLPCQRI